MCKFFVICKEIEQIVKEFSRAYSLYLIDEEINIEFRIKNILFLLNT